MKLEDLKKLCDEATPGPWEYSDYDSEFTKGGGLVGTSAFGLMADKSTCRFIAASRTMIPRLIAVAEAAQNLIDYCGASLRHSRPDAIDIVDGLAETLDALEAP